MKKIKVDIVTTQEIEVELMPCPFCGSNDIDLDCEEPPYCFVKCVCGTRGPHSADETKCVGYWNKRANNPPTTGKKDRK